MKLITVIFLSIAALYSGESIDYFPGIQFTDKIDADPFIHNWYGEQLRSMNEEPWHKVDMINSEEQYRFTCLRTFDKAFLIKLDFRKDVKVFINAKLSSGFGGYKLGSVIKSNRVELNADSVNELKKLFADLEFWGQKSFIDNHGLDGSQWILEGIKGNKYHVIDRWTPKKGDKMYSFGLKLTELSKLDIGNIY